MEALKNHPLLETGQVAESSLDAAVLLGRAKERLGEGKMPAVLTYDRAPVLETVGPTVVPGQTSNASLEIVVIHTKPSETLSALRMAAELASGLAPVRLLAVQVVPYPLDLYAPPVSTQFLESHYAQLVSQANINASVDIRLGRDAGDAIECGVGPHSVVVIGGRRRWWPTATMRLARRLERLGRQVVFTN
ncbi:MAG: hypothetical protein M3N41_01925 [Acidobacteriota bacterium]|nr:hypothetical protein [Acidobacteriota bacterium]